MSKSERYLQLEDELAQIEKYLLSAESRDEKENSIDYSSAEIVHLLLSVPAPNGFTQSDIMNFKPKNDLELEKIRASAFRVLAHAQIESFIEDRAKEIVDIATKHWRTKNEASKTILSLLNFYIKQENSPNIEIRTLASCSLFQYLDNICPLIEVAKPDVPNISEMVISASKYFHSLIENNHGIRRTNLEKLLPPIGVDMSELDPVWLLDMDSFGEKRGFSAHKSISCVSSAIDHRSEINTIKHLLEGLVFTDSIINKLKLDDEIKSEKPTWNQFSMTDGLFSIFY
jgi:hypothetical protein